MDYLLLLSLVILTFSSRLVVIPPVAGQHEDESALNESDSILNHESISIDEFYEQSKCQPMNISFCEGVPYNNTLLPNSIGHQTQKEVDRALYHFYPLVEVNCSLDLKLFLCTFYAPVCHDHGDGSLPLSYGPCRSLCESVKERCYSHMAATNNPWPSHLQCDKFPDRRSNRSILCAGRDDEETLFSNGANSDGPPAIRDLGFVCPKNFEVNSYTLHLNGKIHHNCAMPCENVLLNRSNTQLVRMVVGIIAFISLISTIFTCITYLVDTKRFNYPARPIIIIAFCQFMVALCYMIGFLTSNRISCNDPAEPPKSLPNMKMIRTTTMGNKKGNCTLLFMALYFFQISTMIWWLMMTISWFMIARLKWAPEAVSSVARYFHLFSWAVPAFLTIYLSVLGNIEGDPLTGTCYVSMNNQDSIKAFVIYPVLICILGGFVFLSLGYISLRDTRDTLTRQYGKQTDEHDNLVKRIGLFSLLFIIFATILIGCHYHELNNLNLWMLSWLSNICKNREYSIPCPVRNFSQYAPHYGLFLLKYVATMAMGVISALFMMSEKTLSAYREAAELCNYRI